MKKKVLSYDNMLPITPSNQTTRRPKDPPQRRSFSLFKLLDRKQPATIGDDEAGGGAELHKPPRHDKVTDGKDGGDADEGQEIRGPRPAVKQGRRPLRTVFASRKTAKARGTQQTFAMKKDNMIGNEVEDPEYFLNDIDDLKIL